MPGAATLGAVNRESILSAGEILGVPRRIGERELARLSRELRPAVDDLVRQTERENAAFLEPAGAFLASEARLLYVIKHIIVKEMLERVA